MGTRADTEDMLLEALQIATERAEAARSAAASAAAAHAQERCDLLLRVAQLEQRLAESQSSAAMVPALEGAVREAALHLVENEDRRYDVRRARLDQQHLSFAPSEPRCAAPRHHVLLAGAVATLSSMDHVLEQALAVVRVPRAPRRMCAHTAVDDLAAVTDNDVAGTWAALVTDLVTLLEARANQTMALEKRVADAEEAVSAKEDTLASVSAELQLLQTTAKVHDAVLHQRGASQSIRSAEGTVLSDTAASIRDRAAALAADLDLAKLGSDTAAALAADLTRLLAELSDQVQSATNPSNNPIRPGSFSGPLPLPQPVETIKATPSPILPRPRKALDLAEASPEMAPAEGPPAVALRGRPSVPLEPTPSPVFQKPSAKESVTPFASVRRGPIGNEVPCADCADRHLPQHHHEVIDRHVGIPAETSHSSGAAFADHANGIGIGSPERVGAKYPAPAARPAIPVRSLVHNYVLSPAARPQPTPSGSADSRRSAGADVAFSSASAGPSSCGASRLLAAVVAHLCAATDTPLPTCTFQQSSDDWHSTIARCIAKLHVHSLI